VKGSYEGTVMPPRHSPPTQVRVSAVLDVEDKEQSRIGWAGCVNGKGKAGRERLAIIFPNLDICEGNHVKDI
jgi:hypothetical protein